MTGDELERAIDFGLKNQARAEARVERNEEQLSRLAEQVAQQGADSQKHLESIATAHASLGESLRASDESLRAAMTNLATRQERTEATVDRLSQKVEALVKIVEEERNGGR